MAIPTRTDAILIGVGVLLAVLTAAYIPGIVRAASTVKAASPVISSSASSALSLENIEGIDLYSLSIARQNGF